MMIDIGGGMEISVTKDELGLLLLSVGFFLQACPKILTGIALEGDKISPQIENLLEVLYNKLKDAEHD